MFNLVKSILGYLIRECDSEYTENTYINVELTEKGSSCGTITITFLSALEKNVVIGNILKILGGQKVPMSIYHGDNVARNYSLYKITYKNYPKIPDYQWDLEEEPFEKECDYYIAFLIETDIRTLYNLAPNLKNLVENLSESQNIQIKYIESPGLTEELTLKKNYASIIGESIGTILQYSVSQHRKEIFELLDVEMTDQAVEKIQKLAEETIQNII